jgi:F-type H+-transporting ATPase subunit a
MNGELKGIFPHVLFCIGPLGIRDTVVITWLILVFVACAAKFTSKRLKLYPNHWQEAMEIAVVSIDDLLHDMIGPGSKRYIPLIGTLAVYILFANMAEIIPGLKAPTRDINTTAALAIIVFFSVHYYGVRAMGLVGYVRELAKPVFIFFFLNILAHLTRTVSLAMRLFGNMLSGGFLVAVLALLAPLLVPVPILLFEMFIGIVQAYIFVILAIAYIGGGVRPGEGA